MATTGSKTTTGSRKKASALALNRADRILRFVLTGVLFYAIAASHFVPPVSAGPHGDPASGPMRSLVAHRAVDGIGGSLSVNLTAALTQEAANAIDIEKACLAQAVYFEARGETKLGQRAVAQVIIQRTKNKNFPATICGVVYQGAERRTGCQFSFTCNGSMNRPVDEAVWRNALSVADYMLHGPGRNEDYTGRATHFHTLAVAPVWAASMVHTVTIGNHIFYRFAPRARSAS